MKSRRERDTERLAVFETLELFKLIGPRLALYLGSMLRSTVALHNLINNKMKNKKVKARDAFWLYYLNLWDGESFRDVGVGERCRKQGRSWQWTHHKDLILKKSWIESCSSSWWQEKDKEKKEDAKKEKEKEGEKKEEAWCLCCVIFMFLTLEFGQAKQ